MKRFTVRKVKQYAYSRQGWKLRDLGYVYMIYDREWQKNVKEAHAWYNDNEYENWKYIDNAYKKEVAKHWADWLNVNCSDKFGCKISLPSSIFAEGLELYKLNSTQST